MNGVLDEKLNSFGTRRKRRRRRGRIFSVLAAVTALGTAAALMLPASTATRTAYCGIEEHTHGEECYEEHRTLICTLSEEGHTHTGDCFEEQPRLCCALEESEGHVHGDECRGEEEILVCGLEETEGHVHTEECLNPDGEPICGLEESEPHIHGAECYEKVPVLLCGMEEGEGAHHHDESCYVAEQVLVCTLEETEAHVHTDECYEIEKELICGKEEHEHTLQCFSNPSADLENAAVWEKTFAGTKLTGRWDEDVLAIARTQLGYRESMDNYQVLEDGATMKGYTRYGAWYGIPYGDWCAMFCSFCLNYAEVDRELMPWNSSCGRWVDSLTELELYHPADESLLKAVAKAETAAADAEADLQETAALPEAELPAGSPVTDFMPAVPGSEASEKVSEEIVGDPSGEETEEAPAAEAAELPGSGESAEPYLPKPGDLVFFEYADAAGMREGRPDHVGLLYEIGEEEFSTIEGNKGGQVRYCSYPLDCEDVLGFGELPGNPETPAEEEPELLQEGDLRSAPEEELPEDFEETLELKGKAFSANAALETASRPEELPLEEAAPAAPRLLAAPLKAAASEAGDISFEHNKTIDYLGDGGRNGDTDVTGEDFYRLYLDMTGKSEPIDVLIIVDASGSMSTNSDMTPMSGGNTKIARDAAITEFLNGSRASSTSEGLLAYILGLNASNRVAVVRFFGDNVGQDSTTLLTGDYPYTEDSDVLLNWTSTNSFVRCSAKSGNGTNYEAGFQRATELLGQDAVREDGRSKIVLFFSDGVPTFFQVDASDSGKTYRTSNNNSVTFTDRDVGKRWGNGMTRNSYNVAGCETASEAGFDEFLNANPGVRVFSIGVSKDIDETNTSTSQKPDVLKYMAEKGGGEFLSCATGMADLKADIQQIFYPKGVTITDVLSKYVRYYSADPDVRVTMKEGENTPRDLYRDGAIVAGNNQDGGLAVLSSVTYTPGDSSANPTASTGTVTAAFNSDYCLRENCVYTLSFNVQTTATAAAELTASGYSASGDPETDYGSNATSSGEEGFYSNDVATVSYSVSGASQTEYYARPVVQASAAVDPPAVNPGANDPTFAHRKTIDYLGDGGENDDTNLTGEDFYRLYLDMTGKSDPMDVLIIIDASGSMGTTDMTPMGGGNSITRHAAITEFLNGSRTSSTDDGLLAYILGLNHDNKVAVIRFFGVSADRDPYQVTSSSYPYTRDSDVIQAWTGSNSFVNCANESGNGTNYEAGLMRATELLSQDSVRNDGHRKLVLFFSDGVPTYFQIDANDVGQEVKYQSSGSGTRTLRTGDVGKRWGTGQYANANNAGSCEEPSRRAFDDFMAANPGVTVFAIGVSKDVDETNLSSSQKPDVLKYMAEKGGGEFLSCTTGMADLKGQIQAVFYPRGVTITDSLSKYVRYYDPDPDLLVTVTDGDGIVRDIYRDGAIVAANNLDGTHPILSSVTYTPGDSSANPTASTGTVTARFDSDYCFRDDWIYTLSFNVQTTATATAEYAGSGYNYNAAGDVGSDYGSNNTSSEKAGFYSNDGATVTYTVSGTTYEDSYDLPVVQVAADYGYLMPDTGGRGRGVFLIPGAALVIVSAILLCRRRKRKRE